MMGGDEVPRTEQIDGDRTSRELLVVFAEGAKNIRTFQNRQTTVTNSVLLVLAALVTYKEATKANPPPCQ